MTLREPTSDFPPPGAFDADEAFVKRQPVQAQDALPLPERSEIAAAGYLPKIRKIGATVKSMMLFALYKQEGEMSDLTSLEKEIVALAADNTFPKGGPIPISGTEAGVPEYFEKYVKRLPPDKQRLIHLMLHFVETVPLIFGPEHTLFSLATPENREKALNFCDKDWYFHRIGLQSLRVLLTMGYMANEDVQKAIGCVPDANPFDL